MKRPTKSQFGWTTNGHWINGDQDAYYDALKDWENRPFVAGGRPRSRPIHESWNEVLKLFNPNDPTRSQRAFCAWAGINPATFSSWQTKPITHVENWILEWHWIGDGSTNTNQDRVEDTPKKSPMERGRIIYSQYRQSGYAVPGLKKKKEVKNG